MVKPKIKKKTEVTSTSDSDSNHEAEGETSHPQKKMCGKPDSPPSELEVVENFDPPLTDLGISF